MAWSREDKAQGIGLRWYSFRNDSRHKLITGLPIKEPWVISGIHAYALLLICVYSFFSLVYEVIKEGPGARVVYLPEYTPLKRNSMASIMITPNGLSSELISGSVPNSLDTGTAPSSVATLNRTSLRRQEPLPFTNPYDILLSNDVRHLQPQQPLNAHRRCNSESLQARCSSVLRVQSANNDIRSSFQLRRVPHSRSGSLDFCTSHRDDIQPSFNTASTSKKIRKKAFFGHM
jgi:hypothetical protein